MSEKTKIAKNILNKKAQPRANTSIAGPTIADIAEVSTLSATIFTSGISMNRKSLLAIAALAL